MAGPSHGARDSTVTPFQHHTEDWHRRNVRSRPAHAHKPHRLEPGDVSEGIAFLLVLVGLVVFIWLYGGPKP